MDKKNVFLNYVKNGGRRICSPQIGAGAGFDTKIAGKEWVSETTLEDTITAVGMFDMVPLINIGLCDLGDCNPSLKWHEELIEKNHKKIVKNYSLVTPKGMLLKTTVEEKQNSPFNTKYAITCEDDLDAFEYYLDCAAHSDFSIVKRYVGDLVSRISGRAALSIQWPMQPYEMLCFPNTVDTVLLTSDCPERFKKLMDKIVKLDILLLDAVARGGADFVFLGGPGSEMLSPYHYEEYIVPYSKIVSQEAHNKNLLIYSHICSPIEPMLTQGYYNEMGIDLFETISPPPVGNIKSLEDAMSKIDPNICTRGNLGLDILLDADANEIREQVYKILEATKDRKHIVAASDYLFYGIREENVHAMCEAVNEFNDISEGKII